MSDYSSVLVTGGAGFIGSHVCERLLGDGCKVVCVDNLNDYYSPEVKKFNISGFVDAEGFVFYEKDILDAPALSEIIKSHGVDAVIHLAARAGVRPSIEDPLLYERVNEGGTINLLESCRKNDVGKFVFGSSSSVYGINAKTPFCEEDAVVKQISPYAATKIAGESLSHTYSHLYGIKTTALRFFTVYGPRGRPDMAVYGFTKKISEGERINVFGDGKSSRDYTFVSDIVEGVVSALEKDFDYEVFNLGNSRTVELSELIGLIEDAVGKKAVLEYAADQPGDVLLTYADLSKSRRMLSYEPKVGIKEGIQRFVEWFKETQC